MAARPAEKEDREDVLRTISSTFTIDSTWGDVSREMLQKTDEAIELAFDEVPPTCLVLLHGTRIVGASAMTTNPDAENHLLTGPCILHEYRNRGLGCGLLYASLTFLRDRQIDVVRGITRANTTASRFVYPRFGGTGTPIPHRPKNENPA